MTSFNWVIIVISAVSLLNPSQLYDKLLLSVIELNQNGPLSSAHGFRTASYCSPTHWCAFDVNYGSRPG